VNPLSVNEKSIRYANSHPSNRCIESVHLEHYYEMIVVCKQVQKLEEGADIIELCACELGARLYAFCHQVFHVRRIWASRSQAKEEYPQISPVPLAQALQLFARGGSHSYVIGAKLYLLDM
jgi:hypothetical protein